MFYLLLDDHRLTLKPTIEIEVDELALNHRCFTKLQQIDRLHRCFSSLLQTNHSGPTGTRQPSFWRMASFDLAGWALAMVLEIGLFQMFEIPWISRKIGVTPINWWYSRYSFYSGKFFWKYHLWMMKNGVLPIFGKPHITIAPCQDGSSPSTSSASWSTLIGAKPWGLSMKMRSSSMSFKSLDGICQRSSPCSFLSHRNTVVSTPVSLQISRRNVQSKQWYCHCHCHDGPRRYEELPPSQFHRCGSQDSNPRGVFWRTWVVTDFVEEWANTGPTRAIHFRMGKHMEISGSGLSRTQLGTWWHLPENLHYALSSAIATNRNSGITRTWQPTFSKSAHADAIERAPSKNLALQRAAGEMVLFGTKKLTWSVFYLWVKLQHRAITERHHRPLHGYSPGPAPGAAAAAVHQKRSNADGSDWASRFSQALHRGWGPRYPGYFFCLNK